MEEVAPESPGELSTLDSPTPGMCPVSLPHPISSSESLGEDSLGVESWTSSFSDSGVANVGKNHC